MDIQWSPCARNLWRISVHSMKYCAFLVERVFSNPDLLGKLSFGHSRHGHFIICAYHFKFSLVSLSVLVTDTLRLMSVSPACRCSHTSPSAAAMQNSAWKGKSGIGSSLMKINVTVMGVLKGSQMPTIVQGLPIDFNPQGNFLMWHWGKN